MHTMCPYAAKQRSNCARSVLCLADVSALKESSHFIYFFMHHCPRRVTLSVSAFYIRDLSKTLFCGPNQLHVLPKRAGEKLLHMHINLESNKVIIIEHKIVESFFLERLFISSWMDCNQIRL